MKFVGLWADMTDHVTTILEDSTIHPMPLPEILTCIEVCEGYQISDELTVAYIRIAANYQPYMTTDYPKPSDFLKVIMEVVTGGTVRLPEDIGQLPDR